jgi:hypothetical protein
MNINTTSLSRATSITIWFIVAITIWSELSKPFKTFLADLTGHHWVTKGVVSLVLFVLLYFVMIKVKESKSPEHGIYAAIANAVIGGLVIFVYYIIHFIG